MKRPRTPRPIEAEKYRAILAKPEGERTEEERLFVQEFKMLYTKRRMTR